MIQAKERTDERLDGHLIDDRQELRCAALLTLKQTLECVEGRLRLSSSGNGAALITNRALSAPT